MLLVRHFNRMRQPNYCSYSTTMSIRIDQEHKKVGSELQISINATAHIYGHNDKFIAQYSNVGPELYAVCTQSCQITTNVKRRYGKNRS